jgi:hypothetical protein
MSSQSGSEDTAFESTLSFESHGVLIAWSRRASSSQLADVDSLTVTITSPQTSNLHVESSTILNALQAFPRIRHLSLPKGPEDCSDPSHTQLYDLVLRTIHQCCPKLTFLSIYTNHHSLDFLRPLTHLRTLQFTGFTTSTPMESLSSLARLRHLAHIILIPSPCQHRHSPSPCLTREVLRSLRTLHHITLRENNVDPNDETPTIFDASFIAALAGMTRAPLVRLSIDLGDSTPEESVSRTFGAFLATSHLRQLNVHWGDGGAGADVWVMGCLPRSMRIVKVNRLDADGLEYLLQRRRGGTLPLLSEVIVQVESEDAEVSAILHEDIRYTNFGQILGDLDAVERIQAARHELASANVEVKLVAH